VGGIPGIGNAVSELNLEKKEWVVVDKTQPAQAYAALSHDDQGNPIFISDEPYTGYIHKNGTW